MPQTPTRERTVTLTDEEWAAVWAVIGWAYSLPEDPPLELLDHCARYSTADLDDVYMTLSQQLQGPAHQRGA